LRVLIVDDDPLVTATIEDIVRDTGGTVAGTITSALAAVGAAAVIAPDVVVMDVRLPGAMDGLEAAGIIRLRRRTPVVIITGVSTDPELRARVAGMDGVEVVFKPLYAHTLCPAILRAYERGLSR
jgi:two-component system, response regulator PdtaR